MMLIKSVMVVEDDSDTRAALQIALELEGYQVVVAEDGETALARIAHGSPDIILLDMRMPIMDGRTFAEAYRKTPGPHAPIIVLTAATDAALGAAEIGAAGYVSKPFSIQDLLDALARCGRPEHGA